MEPQASVNTILDLALQLSLHSGPIVIVEFTSIANQLRVRARRLAFEPDVIDECIELYQPHDNELTKRRVQKRLLEVIDQLRTLLNSFTIPVPAA